MTNCNRCNAQIGFFSSLTFNTKTGRCAKCEKNVQQWLAHYRSSFLEVSRDAELSGADWERLDGIINEGRLDDVEALNYVRADALHFLERALAFAFSDGTIEAHEEKNINFLIRRLAIPEEMTANIRQRLAYLKHLSDIRQGRLPTLPASVHLDSDEVCHMEMDATYHKVNTRSITRVPGQFVATNKRLHFLSPYGGAEIQWKRIMRVSREGDGIYLELSTKKANGHYEVPDPHLAEAIIEALVRISKRQLIAPAADGDSRHIPQHVKLAVWQRDQGRCVQCAESSYLEFDHIIPFSKGGASSVNNLQLLCRKCNLAKKDRL